MAVDSLGRLLRMMVVVTVLARLKAAPTTDSCSFSLAGMARSYNSAFVLDTALRND